MTSTYKCLLQKFPREKKRQAVVDECLGPFVRRSRSATPKTKGHRSIGPSGESGLQKRMSYFSDLYFNIIRAF